MNKQLKIKKRDVRKGLRAGSRRGARRLVANPSPTLARLGAAAVGAPAPSLVMQEPEGLRSTLFTGSVTALIHLMGVVVLILVAALAPPEVIPKILSVETVRDIKLVELPGSDLEPAPTGPKSVGPLRPSAAAAMAASQTFSPAQVETLRRAALESGRRAVQPVHLAAPQGTALSARLGRREVSADRLAAHAAAESPTTPVDVSSIEAIQIDPRELSAMKIESSGPQEIDVARAGDHSAPKAFAVLSALDAREYTDAFSASDFEVARAVGIARSAESDGTGTDTSAGLSGEGGEGREVGGGGSGGAGGALDVARCMESVFVARYIENLEARTVQQWVVPDGIAADMQARLRFKIDAAGGVSDIEAVDIQDVSFAESARLALRSAAPFPPMDDSVRCIADRSLRATFDVPSD